MSLVWGVLRSMFFVSIGGGILLFIAGAGIHPDRWIAAVLNVATTPEVLTALFFVLAGVVGLALIVIWDAFDVQRLIRTRVQRRNSLDNTIEFEWARAPGGLTTATGKYELVTLAPVPVEGVRGGPMQVTTGPGSPITFASNGGYECRVTNHGPVAIFNASIDLQCIFWEAVEGAQSAALVTGAGAVVTKGQGKELISRPWNIKIPRIEADPAKPFVFYLSSPNDCFVRVAAPEIIAFQRLKRSDVEIAGLIQPHRSHLIISPPMQLPPQEPMTTPPSSPPTPSSSALPTWLELEQRFKELEPALQFSRIDCQTGAAGEHWRIAGGGGRDAEHRFAATAAMAGARLLQDFPSELDRHEELAREIDPTIRWYKALQYIGNRYEHGHIVQQINDDGSSGGFLHTGTIDKPAAASATLCLALASRVTR